MEQVLYMQGDRLLYAGRWSKNCICRETGFLCMDHGLYAGSQFCIGSIVGDFLLYINNVKFCVLKRINKENRVTDRFNSRFLRDH